MEKFGPEYHKKYYLENRDKYKMYWAQKVECSICKSIYAKSNVTNHLKTKKHAKAISLSNSKENDIYKDKLKENDIYKDKLKEKDVDVDKLMQKYDKLKEKYIELMKII
jgi:hypothetical protein